MLPTQSEEAAIKKAKTERKTFERLNPQQSAERIYADIVSSPEKLEKLKNCSVQYRNPDHFAFGNYALSQVYGTRTEGICALIDLSFFEKVYKPLHFFPLPETVDDIPSDAKMIERFGELAQKNYPEFKALPLKAVL